MNSITIGEMRRVLQENKANWEIDPKFTDEMKVPKNSLGADLSKVPDTIQQKQFSDEFLLHISWLT